MPEEKVKIKIKVEGVERIQKSVEELSNALRRCGATAFGAVTGFKAINEALKKMDEDMKKVAIANEGMKSAPTGYVFGGRKSDLDDAVVEEYNGTTWNRPSEVRPSDYRRSLPGTAIDEDAARRARRKRVRATIKEERETEIKRLNVRVIRVTRRKT